MRAPLAVGLFVGILVSVAIIGLRLTGSLEGLELAAYDWYVRLAPKTTKSTPRVALLGMTEYDIIREGRWPFADGTIADLLTRLVKYEPRAIGLDIYRDVTIPPGMEALEAVLTQHQNIIAAIKVGDVTLPGVPPPPVLHGTDRVGFNDILVDPGGIVRRGLLFLDDGEKTAYSLALRLALLHLAAQGVMPQPDPVNPDFLRLGPATIPPFEANDGGYVGADARGYQFLIDFRDARASFPSYSYASLLSGTIPAEAFRDKIVLVGVTAESVKDVFYTPLSRDFQADQQISGIELHARMVSQLLRAALGAEASIVSTRESHEWLWILAWSLMGGLLGLWVRSAWRFSLVVAGGVALIGMTTFLAFIEGWWIPLVPPALGWILSATVVTAYMANQEKQERALLMQLFSRYVAPEVAEAVWEQRAQFWDGGRPRAQRLTATVLFTDLRGFTTMSESMNPEMLIDWLNGYMDTMARLVMEHGGVIDDYAGDGFKADFGVPLPRVNEDEIRKDAVNAVTCALAMAEKLKELNESWEQQHLPTTQMRIGIATGSVIAGSLGSSQRLKYTTVGDTVNTAARLESLARDVIDVGSPAVSCRILIGEATLRYLGNRFQTERMGAFKLRGKEEEITIHRLVGRWNPDSGAHEG